MNENLAFSRVKGERGIYSIKNKWYADERKAQKKREKFWGFAK